MTTRAWRTFVCPGCGSAITRPWSSAWCRCDPVYAIQGADPGDDWREMKAVPAAALQALASKTPETLATDALLSAGDGTPQHWAVLALRFGLGPAGTRQSLTEIGALLRLPVEAVRKIERDALAQIGRAALGMD